MSEPTFWKTSSESLFALDNFIHLPDWQLFVSMVTAPALVAGFLEVDHLDKSESKLPFCTKLTSAA